MASRKALFACALANTPANVRVVRIRKSLTGCAHPNPRDPNYGLLEAPCPKTRRALQIFLHECAHFALHGNRRKPRHLQEVEAEKWAFARMREAGIPIPRKSLQDAKQHVRDRIIIAANRGATWIAAEARAFAGKPDPIPWYIPKDKKSRPRRPRRAAFIKGIISSEPPER